jgi:hypothetical protein
MPCSWKHHRNLYHASRLRSELGEEVRVHCRVPGDDRLDTAYPRIQGDDRAVISLAVQLSMTAEYRLALIAQKL